MTDKNPRPSSKYESNIRQLMEDRGISYEEARKEWEMKMAESVLKKLKKGQEEEEK